MLERTDFESISTPEHQVHFESPGELQTQRVIPSVVIPMSIN